MLVCFLLVSWLLERKFFEGRVCVVLGLSVDFRLVLAGCGFRVGVGVDVGRWRCGREGGGGCCFYVGDGGVVVWGGVDDGVGDGGGDGR